ncbi:hypothetical protein Csa_022869 [Cucumis sativus]|nr:hypothetical protein Csa_022869 [Cucumis sativus]
MRPIRLREPSSPTMAKAEIFEGGVYGVIRRAVVIGNGSPCAENQCIGLVQALGLADKHVLYRVTRPRGGINDWLHWLPVSLHKKLDYIMTLIGVYTRVLLRSKGRKLVPLSSENGGSTGLSCILEADLKHIVSMEWTSVGGCICRDTITITSSIRRLVSENVFVVQKETNSFTISSSGSKLFSSLERISLIVFSLSSIHKAVEIRRVHISFFKQYVFAFLSPRYLLFGINRITLGFEEFFLSKSVGKRIPISSSESNPDRGVKFQFTKEKFLVSGQLVFLRSRHRHNTEFILERPREDNR